MGFFGDLFGGAGAHERKMARRASAKQDEAMALELAMMKEMADRGREQWDYYKANGRPLEQSMLKEANAGVAPDYEGITNLGGQAAEGVGKQFDLARGNIARNLARRGLTMNDEAARSMDASASLGEAAAKAGAFTNADMVEQQARRTERKYADETTWNRKGAVLAGLSGSGNMGNATLSAAANGMGGVAGGYGNQAATQGELAAKASQAAGGALGGLINAGIKIYGMANGMPPTP